MELGGVAVVAAVDADFSVAVELDFCGRGAGESDKRGGRKKNLFHFVSLVVSKVGPTQGNPNWVCPYFPSRPRQCNGKDRKRRKIKADGAVLPQ